MKRWSMFALALTLALCGCGDDISFDNITARIGDRDVEIHRASTAAYENVVSLRVSQDLTCEGTGEHQRNTHIVYLTIEFSDPTAIPVGSTVDVEDDRLSLIFGATDATCGYRESATVTGAVTFTSFQPSSGVATGSIDVRGSGSAAELTGDYCRDVVPLSLKWDDFEMGVNLSNEYCE